MNLRHILVCALVTIGGPTVAQEPPAGIYSQDPEYRVFGTPAAPEDAQAIGQLMQRFGAARGSGDADAAAAAFASDAEWTNAFGDTVRGSDNLARYLEWLFSLDEEGVRDGEATTYKPISIRYLGDDVAIVHGATLSGRGDAVDGEGLRRVDLTFILAKQDGVWRIVHQQIADIRN